MGVVSDEQTVNSFFACTHALSRLQSSKEWSSNFDKSIKQTLPAVGYTAFFQLNPDLTLTYTGSITIYSEVAGVVYLVARDNPNSNNTLIKNINFAASNQPQKITITINPNEFTGTETQLQLRLVNLEEGTIYSDDWNLTYN